GHAVTTRVDAGPRSRRAVSRVAETPVAFPAQAPGVPVSSRLLRDGEGGSAVSRAALVDRSVPPARRRDRRGAGGTGAGQRSLGRCLEKGEFTPAHHLCRGCAAAGDTLRGRIPLSVPRSRVGAVRGQRGSGLLAGADATAPAGLRATAPSRHWHPTVEGRSDTRLREPHPSRCSPDRAAILRWHLGFWSVRHS